MMSLMQSEVTETVSKQRGEWKCHADRTRIDGREGQSPGLLWVLPGLQFLIHFQLQDTRAPAVNLLQLQTLSLLTCLSFAYLHFGA